MAPYQERMITEQQELTEKLVKLRQYIAREEFASLEEIDRNLLMAQGAHMTDYSNTLAQRIARFDA